MDKNECLQPEKWEPSNGFPYPKLLVRTKLDPSINLEHPYPAFTSIPVRRKPFFVFRILGFCFAIYDMRPLCLKK